MRDLQQRLDVADRRGGKPILEPVLEWQGSVLHQRPQRELATWALMKASVLDGLHPDRPPVTPEPGASLKERETPGHPAVGGANDLQRRRGRSAQFKNSTHRS